MRLQSIQFEKMEGRAALRGPLKAAPCAGQANGAGDLGRLGWLRQTGYGKGVRAQLSMSISL